MPVRLALSVLVLVLAGPLRAAPAPATPPAILTIQSMVNEYRLEDGNVWFTLGLDSDRYWIRFADPASVLPILKSLEESQESGRSLNVWFRHEGAYMDAGGHPAFQVEKLGYQENTWSGFRPRERPKDIAATPAELMLARGVALVRGDQAAAALRELDASLESNSLRDALLPLAVRTRARVLDNLAYADNWVLNDEDDALLVRAVDDARAAAALEPGNVDHLYHLAYLYRRLGALDDAFATLETVEKRFPDESYRVAVRRGATHRQAGDYRAALKSIDDFVDKAGPQGGMMIHYHRAMTLNLLGRHAEAVKEIDLGLKTQPDYEWAFDERACALASQGLIADALADEKQALALYSSIDPAQRTTTIAVATQKRFETVVAELEKAAREAPTKPVRSPCDSAYPEPADYRRDRSRLLPKS